MAKQQCKDLRKQAIAHLKAHRGKWPLISMQTGLDYNWIAKLAAGKINDPGVNKIEKLLSWNPLN